MSLKMVSGTMAAAWLALGISAAAQAPTTDQKTGSITVSGCVDKESAVLKRPAVAANMGMGDEFVITRSVLGPDVASANKPTTEAEPTPAPPATIGTSGSAGNFGKVYRVTGQREGELKPYVGQRVEITGTVKHGDDAKAEVGTSGRELTPENTPEITIVSIRAIPGACSPTVR
jgi:hypothetical protein